MMRQNFMEIVALILGQTQFKNITSFIIKCLFNLAIDIDFLSQWVTYNLHIIMYLQ